MGEEGPVGRLASSKTLWEGGHANQPCLTRPLALGAAFLRLNYFSNGWASQRSLGHACTGPLHGKEKKRLEVAAGWMGG